MIQSTNIDMEVGTYSQYYDQYEFKNETSDNTMGNYIHKGANLICMSSYSLVHVAKMR